MYYMCSLKTYVHTIMYQRMFLFLLYLDRFDIEYLFYVVFQCHVMGNHNVHNVKLCFYDDLYTLEAK